MESEYPNLLRSFSIKNKREMGGRERKESKGEGYKGVFDWWWTTESKPGERVKGLSSEWW